MLQWVSNDTIAEYASFINELYQLRTSHIKKTAMSVTRTTVSVNTWHWCLEHLNVSYLKQLIKIIKEINIQALKKPSHKCKPCLKEKVHQQLSQEPQQHIINIVNLIHVDIVEPITSEAYNESRWYIVFTDDYSHACFFFSIKTKDKVFKKIVNFWQYLFVQMKQKIKQIWIDNELKFKEEKLKTWLNRNEIFYEPIVMYTSEQNEVVKCSNELLTNTVRTMIIDAGLLKNMWSKAIKTACYLLNQSPIFTLLNSKILVQMWLKTVNKDETANPINLEHLKVYESTVYMHISKKWHKKSKKFKSWSRQERLIEYEGWNQYRIWYSDTEKVIQAHNVVFDEEVELIETQTATTEPTSTHSKNDQHDEVTESIEQNLEDNNSLIDEDNNYEVSEQEREMSVKDNASPSQHHVSDTLNDTTEEKINDSNTEKNELVIQPHWTGHQRSTPLRYGLVIKVLVISAVVKAFFITVKNAVTEGELKTYKEAIDMVNSLQWKKTMKKKVQLLKSNQT